jgi:hypothetical protein
MNEPQQERREEKRLKARVCTTHPAVEICKKERTHPTNKPAKAARVGMLR